MTQNRFYFIEANISKFVGKEVEFIHFIPSADKYVTAKGTIKEIGTGCNAGCFIISSMGSTYAIFFGHVTLMDDPKITYKKDGRILMTDTIGTWKRNSSDSYEAKVLGHYVFTRYKDMLKKEILNHLGAYDITLQNGKVVIESQVGTWKCKDIWKEQGGRRDASGNKSVHYIWKAILCCEDGVITEYNREELTSAIINKYHDIIEMNRDWTKNS